MNPQLNHSVTLHQVADRLLVLAQSLCQDYGVPAEVAAELVTASNRCADIHANLERVLDSLDFFRQERDSGLALLRRDCPPQPIDELTRLRPDAQGAYAWDRWQAQALAAGLGEELATLGRALMREAVQHDWDERLKAECGWRDGGQALLGLARRDGESAAERWTYLLETDGERGRWTADGDWVPL